MSYWLITWDWIGEHAKVDNKIVTILNYRLSHKTGLKLIEQLYVDHQMGIDERLSYAKKKYNPFPAFFDRINGIKFVGRIFCGDNPFLFARRVKNICVETNEDGNEILKWDEFPRPKPPNNY